ncbi:MAG: hypothetical protein AB7S38_04840 [Vulcanimicrobiota bacterium]
MSRKRPKMAGGKRLPGVTAAKKPPSRRPAKKDTPEDKLRFQRILATIGFGFCGALAGFLTGANKLATPPPEVAANPLLNLTWMGLTVGFEKFHLAQGIEGLVLGAVIGATMGFSVLMHPGVMLGSWLASGLLLGLAWKFTGSLVVAAVAWMAGFLPFLLREFSKEE